MNDDNVTIIPVSRELPEGADRPGGPLGPACAVLDPGPRPYTVTDMVAGVVAVALLEVLLGKAIASSVSAGWGVAIGLGTFLLFVSLAGLRLRSGIAQWLRARKLARTNLQLASLGSTEVTAREICESVLCLRRCTIDDASPLRRLDIDRARELTPHPLPRAWILSEEGRRPLPGETWAPMHDDSGRRLTPCTVVRESLGRQSSTFAIVRSLMIIVLAITMVLVIVLSGAHVVGCAMSAVLFFIIAGLIPMRRIAFADRVLATDVEGVTLTLDDRARRRRENALRKRAEELGVEPGEIPAEDRFLRQLPREEIRVPWRECFVVLYRPRVSNADESPRSSVRGGAWRWRLYPPRAYWDALGVGGTYAIEVDGLDARETPWAGVAEVMGG